ncbi:MAG TPA: protein-L-isoaspartate O-methyltransferase [Candidatus Saccharimonadales bacterium]|jgi:protein-L-isoaspartate(D-aspartate) O-methyltransferase|nr:protein-L-isoaspartate O-methyltransferase [Candidatus Saccharimonadales bacterium]
MELIDKAFKRINRQSFVPDHLKDLAIIDGPLPIGYGQTISQPTTVRMMLSWLDIQPGNKILDVGSGSGWSSALLAYLTGPTGQVLAVERIPYLMKLGKANCRKIGISNVEFFKAGKELGLIKYAPYDRILVSAAADKLSESLITQLKIGGKMVIPVRHDILEITKTKSNEYKNISHPGFVFVPLI